MRYDLPGDGCRRIMPAQEVRAITMCHYLTILTTRTFPNREMKREFHEAGN